MVIEKAGLQRAGSDQDSGASAKNGRINILLLHLSQMPRVKLGQVCGDDRHTIFLRALGQRLLAHNTICLGKGALDWTRLRRC